MFIYLAKKIPVNNFLEQNLFEFEVKNTYINMEYNINSSY